MNGGGAEWCRDAGRRLRGPRPWPRCAGHRSSRTMTTSRPGAAGAPAAGSRRARAGRGGGRRGGALERIRRARPRPPLPRRLPLRDGGPGGAGAGAGVRRRSGRGRDNGLRHRGGGRGRPAPRRGRLLVRTPFRREAFLAVPERVVSRPARRCQNAALQRQPDDERRQPEQEPERAVQVRGDLLPWVAPALAGLGLAARCPPVLTEATSRSGAVTLEPGDALVVYGDGRLDASPGAALAPPALAAALRGAGTAPESGRPPRASDRALRATARRPNRGRAPLPRGAVNDRAERGGSGVPPGTARCLVRSSPGAAAPRRPRPGALRVRPPGRTAGRTACPGRSTSSCW